MSTFNINLFTEQIGFVQYLSWRRWADTNQFRLLSFILRVTSCAGVSMNLLKEAISLADSDDRLKTEKIRRKKLGKLAQSERELQQVVAAGTSVEYDPEADVIIPASGVRKSEKSSKNCKRFKKNISLLERSRKKQKVNMLKRNLKYALYENGCRLDAVKTGKVLDLMNKRYCQRMDILEELRHQSGCC
ncbi:unnamed protein product [Gongylonema pulchrum]|uniref:Uncharacterized protein n=1 Tax=Gongylonema pulchrum TaxID=637853 RepID=A0A183DQR3_9BILA|nr:unnamed protein product [Gongylonema pulchrum]